KRLAGFGGNINTIGSIQPVDLPDVSGEAYPRQIDLGHVVEVDVKLNGPTSVEDQLTGITLVKKGKKDKLVATHGDLSEKRVAEMKSVHENIILTVGINEEKDVMSQRDENSRRIRGEARAKLAKGEDAGIYNTQEVFEKIGDPSSPEPLKEFQEEVIVVGGGDSAKVFLSKLFGYEGKTGIQNATANWPKKVTWIGVSEKTKNEWVKSQRVRYHELGLEFSRGDEYPKDKFPDFEYFNRIQTVEGKAVARVEGTIGGVKKFGYRVENNGQTSEYFAKAAVEATGFIDRTDELVLGIYQRDLKVSNFGNINSAIARVRDFNSDAAKNNLTEVLKNLGNFAEIEFEPQRARRRGSPEIGSVRKVRVINASDNCFTFRVAVEIFDAAGKKKYYTLDEIMALSLNERVNLFDNVIVANVKTGVPPVEAVYAEDDTSQESPIAVKYKDVVDQSGELRRVNVYKAGVAARLPLSEVERKSSPPAGKIKENSAALFFQTPRTEKLMRLLLNRYTREQVRVPLAQRFKSDLNAVDLRQDKLVNFSSPEDERPAPIELLFKPNGKKLKKNLPYDYVPNDILLDQVITSLDKYRFPVNYSNLQFRINRASGASTDNFEFTVSSGLPDTNQGKDLLRSLFGQPEMQRLIQDRFQYENIRSLSQRLSAKLNATFRDAEIKERIFSRTTEANIRGISAPPFDNPDVKKIVLEAFIDSRIGKKATNFLQGEEADQLFADILDDDEVRTLVLEELKQSENEALILTVGLHDLEQNAGERETKWPKVLDMRKITLNRVGGTPPVRNVRRKIGKSNA
ncbi:MAG TPA: hypothetical protein VEA59_01505, partial [Patescibacteria group bacterium]|nr:hypothetical protein [Patescibacteria group bacterium]